MKKPANSPELIFEETTVDQALVDCQTAVKHKNQNVSDCQDDNRSCISKDNVVVMATSHHIGGSDHAKATDSSKGSEGNKILNTITPVANTQEPLLKSQMISHGDGSDELIDVRVCDICGDAGREALLALCSMCPDGAEHIYCMRNKMDEVPEKDWMCEECDGMQKLKGKTQVVARRGDTALSPTCLEEMSQPLPRNGSSVKHAGELSTKQSGKAFSLSGKKRMFEESIYPLKSPCRGVKTKFTRISSMKSMDKETIAAPQGSFDDRPAKRAFEPASSVGHRSLISEKRFCKGFLYKSKMGDNLELNMKVQQSKDDVLLRIDTAKESTQSKLKTNFPNKKLFKSLSFAGPVSSDVTTQFSYISKSNGLKCGSERNLSKNVYVPEKTNRPFLSVSRSCSMKVRSSRTKVVSETAKAVSFADKKSIPVGGKIKVESSALLAQEGRKHANISVGEKLSSVRSTDAIRSLKKDINNSSHPTWKAKINSAAKDSNHHSAAVGKFLQHELHPGKFLSTLAPAEMALSGSSAVPASECIWKGGFKLEKSGKFRNYCSGVQAHVSNCASSKVHEVVSMFRPKLLLKELPRSEIWPTYFRKNCPTEQDIALYFFAEDLQSYERSYKMLLDSMIRNDLVLEASFDGIQLLVLPSSLLPVTSQRWNTLFYLWGVCRMRKVDNHSSHTPDLGVATLNQDMRTPVTYGSSDNCVSLFEAGNFPGSHPSHNSIQRPQAVNPLLLQSSALTKSSDQSCDYDASSVKCLRAQDETDMQPDRIQSVHDLRGETFVHGTSHTDDMLKRIQSDDQDRKCTTKAAIFPFGQSNGESMLSLAINNTTARFYSDDICRDLSFPWIYNRASESCSRPDIASQSSFSIDSGPSGSSDGCAISEKPSSSRALNLNLCLGCSSQPEEQVDLNLMLGFPGTYQPESYSEIRNTMDENASLVLSLGMPCSNA